MLLFPLDLSSRSVVAVRVVVGVGEVLAVVFWPPEMRVRSVSDAVVTDGSELFFASGFFASGLGAAGWD